MFLIYLKSHLHTLSRNFTWDYNRHSIVISEFTGTCTAQSMLSISLVQCHGPVTQETFLHNMGIGLRLQVSGASASLEVRVRVGNALDKNTCSFGVY